ncbi:MAG: hypothetical protein JO279_03090 [Verrucomicrobia bacterium]|nr:hypothetical protein [Verrucomicrobiota bacterium]
MLTRMAVVFTLQAIEAVLTMHLFNVTFLALLLFAVSASAAYWESEDFDCSIQLPDSNSSNSETNWSTIGSTEEGTLVGAARINRSAFIFLGYVDLSKRKNFHLNEKSIEELEKRYFGEGQGFRRGLERISLHGMQGYRLTGDSVYHGAHYGLVVEMFEANNRIYQIAGMKEDDLHPLKDPDIRGSMSSFKLLSR